MSLRTLTSLAKSRGLLDDPGAEDSEWELLLQSVRATTRTHAVPEQLRFIEDRSEWSLAFCGRQCGKGWSVARMMIEEATEGSGDVVLYVRRTRQLAEETMWSEPKDGLLATLRGMGFIEGVHYAVNLSRLRITFQNGSEIRCEGIERQAGWANVRGKKYRLIVLDEMQEQENEGLRQALDADIPACFAMYGGRFVGIGTPGQVSVGRFHDICEDVPDPETGVGRQTGWSVHRWRSYHLRERTPVWANLLRWKLQHRIPDDNPRWRRDGLGEWCADASDLMLSIPAECIWQGVLPGTVPTRNPAVRVPRRQPMRAYAGLDFGFTAPCGMVVGSISREEGTLRELHSEKRAGLQFQQVSAWVRELVERHGIVRVYADYEEPRLIQMLQSDGLPVSPCDKSDYDGKLSQMRGALLESRLQILEGSELREELRSLAPDPKELLKGQTRPKPGQDDHCFDALRYLFNGVYREYYESPEPPMTPQELREAELQRLIEREQARTIEDRSGGFDPRRRTR